MANRTGITRLVGGGRGKPTGMGRDKRQTAAARQAVIAEQRRQVLVTSERRIDNAERACDDLLAAMTLVTHAYHLRIEWMDDSDLTERCLSMTPWLLPVVSCPLREGSGGQSHGVLGLAGVHGLAGAYGARCILVLGDPLTRTILLSRRVLRLLTLRARHPALLDVLSPFHPPSAPSAPSAPPADPRLEIGPVARMALCQSDALLMTAALMSADGWLQPPAAARTGSHAGSRISSHAASPTSSPTSARNGANVPIYVTLAPRSLSEVMTISVPGLPGALVEGGMSGRVLTLPRACAVGSSGAPDDAGGAGDLDDLADELAQGAAYASARLSTDRA